MSDTQSRIKSLFKLQRRKAEFMSSAPKRRKDETAEEYEKRLAKFKRQRSAALKKLKKNPRRDKKDNKPYRGNADQMR